MIHPYFNKDIETAPREILEEAQFTRLKSKIEFAYEEKPFYRKRFTEHTISPEDIRSIEDITKLPYLCWSSIGGPRSEQGAIKSEHPHLIDIRNQ